MPVGRCVMRTAESVLFTCWPPAPDGAVGVDLDVVGLDLHLHGVLHERRHLDAGEGGVAARLRVVRRDPHQPVHALLGGEQPVGVLAARDEGGRLDPGLLPRATPPSARPSSRGARPSASPCAAASRPSPASRCRRRRRSRSRRRRRASYSPREQARLLELGQARLDRGALLLELGRRSTRPPRPSPRAPRGRRCRARASGRSRAAARRTACSADTRGRALLVVPEAGRLHLALELA